MNEGLFGYSEQVCTERKYYCFLCIVSILKHAGVTSQTPRSHQVRSSTKTDTGLSAPTGTGENTDGWKDLGLGFFSSCDHSTCRGVLSDEFKCKIPYSIQNRPSTGFCIQFQIR